MKSKPTEDLVCENSSFILALHSSSEDFGVAILDSREPFSSLKTAVFPIGRQLSNSILSCVNTLLPFHDWPKLVRISVATGPGGFTGTRLSIVMARTLAQQLSCPLDGFSSFSLMAPRLLNEFAKEDREKPFWICKSLERRGLVAGCYQVLSNSQTILGTKKFLELETPKLIPFNSQLNSLVEAKENVDADVRILLERSYEFHAGQQPAQWTEVLPIYPTSPVGRV